MNAHSDDTDPRPAEATSPDADADIVAGRRPPSAKTPLSRERIVATAIEYIDSAGLAGLTMRRLGAMLGVEAMALYRYVPGKEDLLDAVVESLVTQLDRDEAVIETPTHGWQDFLQRLAHGLRRVALEHPKVFPLVASRPPEAPWLRPPLRTLDWVETFLQALTDEDFSDDAAAAAYRAFTSFLLGHLLLEVSAHGGDVGPLDVVEEADGPAGGLEHYPAVRRLKPQLSEDHAAVEFEEALEELLERLALLRSEHTD